MTDSIKIVGSMVRVRTGELNTVINLQKPQLVAKVIRILHEEIIKSKADDK